MFKHILLPTDGSPASQAAIPKILAFAKSIGANVTAVHVMAQFHVFTTKTEMLEDTKEAFARDSRAHAAHYLEAVETAAAEAGVACNAVSLTAEHPHEAIVRLAAEDHCDLIAMASHGRKGIKDFLLGSETQKVLLHSSLPVLVYR
jgi:nucleotide-binding universal stress UspA family protein